MICGLFQDTKKDLLHQAQAGQWMKQKLLRFLALQTKPAEE